jgi:hypothetical protein
MSMRIIDFADGASRDEGGASDSYYAWTGTDAQGFGNRRVGRQCCLRLLHEDCNGTLLPLPYPRVAGETCPIVTAMSSSSARF